MKIDYDNMMSIYNDLNSLTKDLLDNVNGAKSVVNKMNDNDHWDGMGYDAYKKKFNALSNNFGDYINIIYSVNNRIKSSVDYYKNIDLTVQGKATNTR